MFVKWIFPIFPLVFLWLWLLEYEDFSILMRGVIVAMRVRRFLDSHESCLLVQGYGDFSIFMRGVVVGTRVVWRFLDSHERSCCWYKSLEDPCMFFRGWVGWLLSVWQRDMGMHLYGRTTILIQLVAPAMMMMVQQS